MSLRKPRSLSASAASGRRRSSGHSDLVSSRMSSADLSSGLIKAIRASDESWMNALLAAGAPPNARDDQGRPALCLLLDVWGSPDACKTLLERGARPDLPAAGTGQTALHIAAKKGYQVCVGQLLSAGATPDLPDAFGNTPLMYSCANDHHTSVRTLIKAGVSTGRTNQKGETGLHLAAKNGSYGCVKELLTANCSANVADSRGLTPLLLAAQNNRGDVIQLLLESTCRIDEQDPSTGRTTLHWTVLNHDLPNLQKLIDLGADLDLRDADWNTAFFLAISLRDWDAAQILVEAGCDVTVTDKSFNTALHLTSRDGHEELIPVLFESGLNLDLRGNGGMTALMLGSFGAHRGVVSTLLSLGANPNLLDRNRASALVYAMLSNASQDLVNDIVRILIQFNADLEEGANLIGISRGVSLPPGLLGSSLEDRLYSPIEIAFLRENSPLCVMLTKVGCDLEPLRQLAVSRSNGRSRQTTNGNKDLFHKLIQFSRRQRRKVPSLKELSRRPALVRISQFTSLAHIHELCLPETLIRFLRYEDLLEESTQRPKSATVQNRELGRTDTKTNSHLVSKKLHKSVNDPDGRDAELERKKDETLRRDPEEDKRTVESVRRVTERNRRTADSRERVAEARRNVVTNSQEENVYRRRQSKSPFDRRRRTELETAKSENTRDQTIQTQKPGRLTSSSSQGNLRTPSTSRLSSTNSSSQANLRTPRTPRQLSSSSSQRNLRAPSTPRESKKSSSQVNLRTPRQSSQTSKATPISAKTGPDGTTPHVSYSREPCVRPARNQTPASQGLRSFKSTGSLSSTRAEKISRSTPNSNRTVIPTSGQVDADIQPRTIRSSTKSVHHLERPKPVRKPVESHL